MMCALMLRANGLLLTGTVVRIGTILICLAGTIGCSSSSKQSLSRPGVSSASTSLATSAAKDMPMNNLYKILTQIQQYPGAEDYSIQASHLAQPYISFKTLNDYKDVMEFYKRQLEPLGWYSRYESDDGVLLVMTIQQDSSGSPLELDIKDIEVDLTIDAAQSDGKYSTIRLAPTIWPQYARVPLSQGATNVKTSLEVINRVWESRTVTYTSSQSASEVGDFYKGILPKQGWRLDKSTPTVDPEGDLTFLVFRPSYNSNMPGGGSLHIHFESSSGLVKITATLTFNRLQP